MINVYYRYSDLDKEHQYSVESTFGNTTYYIWIWFYLAKTPLGRKKGKIWFTPFKGFAHEKIIKSYKEIHEAKKLAEWISNTIIKDFNRRKA